MREQGVSSLRVEKKVFDTVDLRTLEAVNVEAEVRTAGMPVAIVAVKDAPMLAPLLLILSQSSSLLSHLFSKAHTRPKTDLLDSMQTALSLLVHSTRRSIDISALKVARSGESHSAAHCSSGSWEGLCRNLWEGVSWDLGAVKILENGEFEDMGEVKSEVVGVGIHPPHIAPFSLRQYASSDPAISSLKVRLSAAHCQLSSLQHYNHSPQSAQHILSAALDVAAEHGASSNLREGLESLRTQVSETVSRLQAEIEGLNADLETLRSQVALDLVAYTLFAVVCSYLPSGSFLTYVKRNGLWYKFTSWDVSEVASAEVEGVLAYKEIKTAPKLAAYCLPQTADLWGANVPLTEAAESANKRFEKDLQDYRDTELVLRITELYVSRVSALVSLHHQYREASLNSPHSVVRYEVMNFPYFLKLKADDNLCKWVVLDQCVREVDPLARGLCDFDERSGFVLKLKSQLLGGWRDVPRFLVISLYEKLQLERLLESFLTSCRELTVALYVLSQLNSGCYAEAFAACRIVLDPMPAEPSNYMKIARDAAKVMSLRLVSLVAAGDKQWVTSLETMKALLGDPGDIHVRQVTASLEFLKGEIGADTCTPGNVDLEYPGPLQDKLDSLQERDCYAWMDLKGESAALAEEMRRMKEGALAPWVRLHVRLTISKQLLPQGELESLV